MRREVIHLANDDAINNAINDFASEEPGEPNVGAPPAAEPLASPADVHARSSHDLDVLERAHKVDFEELFSQIDAGELSPLADEFEPEPQVDFDELADIYASPSSPEVAPTPKFDGAVSDVYGSYAPEVQGRADSGVMRRPPAPLESSSGVQLLAALATVGMLTLGYAVFVNQRSSQPLSMPSRVAAPAPAPTTDPEPDQVASLDPPAVSDVVPPPPRVQPHPSSDDPFGLTRGLSPSIPLQGFDPPPRPTAADKATPPATEPAAPVATAAAPAAAAPKPPPSSTPSSTPRVVTPPRGAPPTATTAPPARASVPRNPAPPPTPVPSPSGASAPSTAALAPTPTPTPTPAPAGLASPPPGLAPAPAPSAPAPAAASPSAASAVVDNNQTGIENTLARYVKAFSALNASAAREVWPTVNERSLSRAFDRLEQQDVWFDRCQIKVTNSDRAEATCNGTASYVPRVGSRTLRVDEREWRFNLVKVKDQWLIGAVDAR